MRGPGNIYTQHDGRIWPSTQDYTLIKAQPVSSEDAKPPL